MSSTEFDQGEYRRALGCFATGVAVVTALDKNGERAGITINSFNSVSLNPPLVLWCIAADSQRFDVFAEAEHFAVNVLATHQRDISERLAASGNSKLDDLDCTDGIAGVPILPTYSAVFECQTEQRYEVGDHTIVVGRVLKFKDRKTDPLIFYRGHYLE